MSEANNGEQTLLPVPVRRYRPLVECLDCGAELTNSDSRRWGRGRQCRAGITSAPGPGTFHVDQDTLPAT
ncbi:DUF6011 domain-containing protein [Streptomyces scabiei]|uniref:DUF6011 domain-containing protein n=1 Tax=Streptomyces scabiei TaxID=1930 RepID=UPI0029AEEA05|nr:DUF6011 domain-containing protein [Streptomyces scabiei]MDX3165994.1 DUF6011 domain-containing protein [Streptomyces scabiei]